MNDMTVAERVRSGMDAFSPQERRAARALLAEYPRSGLGTSAELAAAAGVSAPTVIRIARALGFAGFADLQQSLVVELTDRMASPVTRQSAGRSPGNRHWLDHGLELAVEAIRRSLGHIPHTEVDAAVGLLADHKRRITCTGGRYSNIVAQYLAAHLQQLRPGVAQRPAAQDFGLAATIDVTRRDVYVLYDVRRYQRSTVELARRLDERGAQIIVVTDPWLSPAANFADIVLPTAVDSPSAFDSLTPAFVLTELLIGAVLDAGGPKASRRVRDFEDASGYEMLP